MAERDPARIDESKGITTEEPTGAKAAAEGAGNPDVPSVGNRAESHHIAHALEHRRGDRLPPGLVAHNQPAPRLRVRPTRRPDRRVDHLPEHLLRYRLVLELADRPLRVHDLEEIHVAPFLHIVRSPLAGARNASFIPDKW